MNMRMKSVVVVIVVILVFSLMVAMVAAKGKKNDPQPLNENVSLSHFDVQPVLGDPNAPVSIVEFGDFKCPGCQYFAMNIYPEIVRDFIDTGKANFKFVNFPFLGPDSHTAAEASEYVLENSPEDFWTYFEEIYKNQGDESENWATIDYLITLAKQANVNVDYHDMEKSLLNGVFSEIVNEDLEFSRNLQIRQTPSLIVNGTLIQTGSMSYKQIKEAIEQAIGSEVE
ncbi:DsbA family protein [Paenibacillus glucanolyticus]|jgi:protein-disulfide isomerase|uniref:Thioredoxin domain-containing protein n=1 Tax=Paenibacillus glucanolyticus TaxID=59843 RepID=A0A168EWE9_9BACL|nr:DsbA family protein [Paenibacillus glucanolyticus]KZS44892.1 hypothetical protein AWU65_02600 [Paenibacillus glucanolyticus]OMF65560.1 hypothetical protein BK142_30585 [Paenibacillus glucanolyticus]